ncbi:MAG TPA: hypothetical protein VM869_10210 [Enhygromyxa sp.]|nr:hypothetical protein [Enhygromyxa sp.]
MRRASTWLAMLAPSLLALLWSPSAHAREDEQGRPFARGTVIPRVGIGFGYSQDLFSISWGVGAGYFVANGLELGASVGGTHLIWGRDIKDEYPGIEDKLPGTLIEITPHLRYVFFRNQWFSPYAFAGVGPTFLTNNAAAPTIGHWTAGPGFYIGLGRHVFLDLAVRFSGRFPGQTCADAFTDVFETDEGLVELEIQGYCGFQWSPSIGIGFSF